MSTACRKSKNSHHEILLNKLDNQYSFSAQQNLPKARDSSTCLEMTLTHCFGWIHYGFKAKCYSSNKIISSSIYYSELPEFTFSQIVGSFS